MFLFDTLEIRILKVLLNSSFVHVCYFFLEHSADVSASTLQCRGEKAVGDVEHLWVQVKALYLPE